MKKKNHDDQRPAEIVNVRMVDNSVLPMQQSQFAHEKCGHLRREFGIRRFVADTTIIDTICGVLRLKYQPKDVAGSLSCSLYLASRIMNWILQEGPVSLPE
jgi:hypothetical protein